jgi:flavin reductase (DIM6/NTAB) family NADH-FMN oxidoreductase RutF
MLEQWENITGRMTYGIYLLTSAHREEINGMIASWVSQISYDPPLISVAVHPNRYSHRLIEKSGRFALHVLAKSQRSFLQRFKGPDRQKKFDSIAWRKGVTGSPVLSGCPAWLECEVRTRLQPGNHSLFIAEAVAARVQNPAAQPLTTRDYEGVYLGKA